MTIAVSDIQFFKSERMTDFPDGGGRMTANPIISGQENQIFDDVSDQDRAVGEFSIRKAYVAVTSANADAYMDAGIAVLDPPDDPAASVLLFSDGSHYSERADLQGRIEQTITRGPRYNGWLYGQHLSGQRALLLWQRPEAAVLPAGARLELIAKAGTAEQYSQYVWITRVRDELRTMYEVYSGSLIQYQVRVLVCELAEPLAADYTGSEPARSDPAVIELQSMVYETRYNAEAVPLYGVKPLTEAAAIGDFSAAVGDLYAPLIPTAFVETALPDVTPGADTLALVAGHAGTISFNTSTPCIKPDASLFLGSPCTPGTLSVAVSGSTLKDDNGNVTLAGATVGRFDYGNGVIVFNSACPNYGAAPKAITFRPAARPLRVADTAAQQVTAENRGYVWTITLKPIPAPGTLRVAYRVNNIWYVLTDQGGGTLRGADSSYGSGNLSFATGTLTLSTGALPDVGSDIIYAWGTTVNYLSRGGSAVDAPVVRGQTAHPSVKAGASVTWTVGATTHTLTDSNGTLAGSGGAGFINRESGEWWVRPSVLPPIGTQFTITYEYGEAGTPGELKTAYPAAAVSGEVYTLTLPDANIAPNSVTIEYTVGWQTLTASNYRISDRDNGAGALAQLGGTVTYSAGALAFDPLFPVSMRVEQYNNELIGESGGVPVYRRVMTGFATGSYTPDFVTGTAPGSFKVTYRLAGTASYISATETVTLAQLELDLTKGFQETIALGGTRFRVGADLYAEAAGQLYRNPSPDSGAGVLAGTIDRVSGRVYLSVWTAGEANTVSIESLVTELGGHPVDEVVFRTPIAPLKPGLLQLRYAELTGAVRLKSVDSSGSAVDSDITLKVDQTIGVVRARFGRWRVDSELTPAEKSAPWYDPNHRVDIAGTLKIWQPVLVLADSIVYNAVAQTFLPPDSTLLGLNAARLPPDGRALIYNSGRLVLVHNTDTVARADLSPTQVIDCGRTRLYRAGIQDSTGKRLPASQYVVDRIAGTVTMAASLDLTGFAGPYAILHTVADLARLVAVDISGRLSLNKPLSHAYPPATSYCSGVLPVGTLQARVSRLFSQAAWTGVWSDTRIGDAPLAQYNDAQWPVLVSNLGAYTDRILFRFTSATAFQVIGENLGIIGTGDIFSDCAPVNALTGQPYFSIRYQGWGTGWATGYCLRLNLIGANYPVAAARAIQPSNPTGQTVDAIELLLIGNVDA